MVRPEGRALILAPCGVGAEPCCLGLAGGSPAAVSAGAPRSRLRAWAEMPASERSVKSPQAAVRSLGGEQVCGPQCESVNLVKPRERNFRKVERPSRSCHGEGNRLHLRLDRRGAGRSRGIEGDTQSQPEAEQERPSPAAHVGRSVGDKPSAKRRRAGRESEGLVVPMTVSGHNATRGKGPCFGHARSMEVSARAWS
jgi:hypothetical protein